MKMEDPIKMYFIGRRGYYCRGCAVAGSCECHCGPCADVRFEAHWKGEQLPDTCASTPKHAKEDPKKKMGQGSNNGGNEVM